MAEDDPEGLDGEESSKLDVLEVGRYVLAAAKRHWLLGSILGLLIASMGIAVAWILPPKYKASSSVFVAQAGTVAAIEGKSDKVDPKKGVAEKVLRSDNLRAIVVDARLDELWAEQRTSAQRFKDRLRGSLADLSKDDRIAAVAGVLEQRLHVRVERSGTIFFTVEWGDAQTAADIVNITRRRFLEERLQEELAVLTAAIKILEGEVATAAEAIEPRLAAVDAAYNRARGIPTEPPDEAEDGDGDGAAKKPRSVVVYKKPATPQANAPDPSLAERLNEIRASIRTIQEPWERKVAELEAKLSDMRTVYGPQHPAVTQQRMRIETAKQPPPELASLQAEERQLLKSIEQAASAPPEVEATAVRVRVSGGGSSSKTPPHQVKEPTVIDSAAISAERSKLVSAIEKYDALTDRLDATRLEVTSAKAAFNHRYAVLEEAKPPPGPANARVPLILTLGGMFAGVAIGLFAGAARELASGRMLDIWQVRQLGLPVLAEVEFKHPSSPLRQG